MGQYTGLAQPTGSFYSARAIQAAHLKMTDRQSNRDNAIEIITTTKSTQQHYSAELRKIEEGDVRMNASPQWCTGSRAHTPHLLLYALRNKQEKQREKQGSSIGFHGTIYRSRVCFVFTN